MISIQVEEPSPETRACRSAPLSTAAKAMVTSSANRDTAADPAAIVRPEMRILNQTSVSARPVSAPASGNRKRRVTGRRSCSGSAAIDAAASLRRARVASPSSPRSRDQPPAPDFRSAHDSFRPDTHRCSPHPSQRVDGKNVRAPRGIPFPPALELMARPLLEPRKFSTLSFDPCANRSYKGLESEDGLFFAKAHFG
jgi:hypothetical protein